MARPSQEYGETFLLTASPFHPHKARYRLLARGVLTAAATVLLVALPSPAQGASRAAKPSASSGFLCGGTVELRSVPSRAVFVFGGAFPLGATPSDLVFAIELCQREPIVEACDDQLFAGESPSHTVATSSFRIDTLEVSVRQFARCVDLGACEAPRYRDGGQRFERPFFPVSFVTWAQAVDYCRFRGSRLPTEAEWELAARGHALRRFPWGDLYNSHLANHGRMGIIQQDPTDGYSELAPVGSFPAGATPSGIFDLAGNVSEWVADAYQTYQPTPDDGAAGAANLPTAARDRVIRGGDFISGAPWLRNTARRARPPEYFGPDVGFRCATDLKVGVH